MKYRTRRFITEPERKMIFERWVKGESQYSTCTLARFLEPLAMLDIALVTTYFDSHYSANGNSWRKGSFIHDQYSRFESELSAAV